jgi:phage shock protein PspC (stress-responsive transcriptional regulator)
VKIALMNIDIQLFLDYFYKMNTLKYFVETKVFGVCTYLGDQLNMPKKNIRLFFIYLSFATAGSMVVPYLIIAFWVKLREYINGRRVAVWDL